MEQPVFLRPSKRSRTWVRNVLFGVAALMFIILVVVWHKSPDTHKISQISSTISNHLPSQISNISFLNHQDNHASEDNHASRCSIYSAGFKDVENTERYWKTVGGMNRTDLETSRYVCQRFGECVMLKIYNGQLYIRIPIETGIGPMSRLHAMIILLFQTDYSEVPNVDFLVNAGDWTRGEPCFMEMSKHTSERDSQTIEHFNHFLLPDFTTLDWWEAFLPPFSDVRNHMAEDAGPFLNKTPKMFYRGTLSMNGARADLVNRLGNETDIADVKAINGVLDKENMRTIRETCAFKYIIYTEGHTYSGRLKYQAMCNSVNMGKEFNFIEWWTHLLEPYYVVTDTWDDAIVKYWDMEDNPKKAEALASEMTKVVGKHLSPRGVECYIQRLATGFAKSSNWEVLSPKEDISGRVRVNEEKEGVEAIFEMQAKYEWLPIEQFVVRGLQKGTYAGFPVAWKFDN